MKISKSLLAKFVGIYLTSFIAWFHCIVYIPLGYMYNTYPNMEALVMLIATIPGIMAMVGGVLAGKVMHTMGKKQLVIVSMLLMLAGSMGLVVFGMKGIGLAVVLSALTGFAGGAIPAVNYTVLSEIAPEKFRDKVAGWSDAFCLFGLMIASFLCGVFSADGIWTRAYTIYFAVIPVLFVALFMYPSDKKIVSAVSPETTEEKESTEDFLPKSIIALLIIKVLAGCFYAGFGVFYSDYIINDMQMGTSTLVGTVGTVMQLVNTIGAAIVFIVLQRIKGFTSFIAQMFIGIFMIVLVTMKPSVPGLFICMILIYIGVAVGHSGFSTLMSMVPKGKYVGTVAGLFMAATFIGESLCGYIAPFMAKIFLGTGGATNSMKICGIFSIVVGVISLPFFIKAYKLGFKKETTKQTQS